MEIIGKFPLIDLGSDYFIVKFNNEENIITALQNGPWFVNGFFLSIKKWEPNFIASEATQERSAIWIGNTIGRLLKIDACTSATLREKYARLCVEMPLDEPVQTCIFIGKYMHQIIYEGEQILGKLCGRLGHTIQCCTHTKAPSLPTDAEVQAVTTINYTNDQWQTVSFDRRRRTPPRMTRKNQYHPLIQHTISQGGDRGINVKIFEAATGAC
ncbi:uncharacterized protein [Nicotiana sylvestris]|uniref:Uncharacterized protein LOC104217071 n=1 Tax=Nicotiana sylvestris TaxID=4096 RepID=A0A1U7VT26_NICSY|nr:PREDICTED: uncharacterized protein LOC104217071 [Nicotiana sylvestris]